MLDMAKAGFPCAWGVQDAKEGRKEGGQGKARRMRLVSIQLK